MSDSDHDDQSATGAASETPADKVGVPDEDLPEDLQPGEDNPLAEGLEPGETVEELLEGGKPAEQDDPDDSNTGDTGDDGDPPTGAPEAARV